MSQVTIHHGDTETTIEDPNFIDTLCNVNEVSVNGRIFEDVTQVQFRNDA